MTGISLGAHFLWLPNNVSFGGLHFFGCLESKLFLCDIELGQTDDSDS